MGVRKVTLRFPHPVWTSESGAVVSRTVRILIRTTAIGIRQRFVVRVRGRPGIRVPREVSAYRFGWAAGDGSGGEPAYGSRQVPPSRADDAAGYGPPLAGPGTAEPRGPARSGLNDGPAG